MTKKNKTLILDESTWRCGYDTAESNNRRGNGVTELLNKEGYMCCLGGFTQQLSPGIDIFGASDPSCLTSIIPLLSHRMRSGIVNTEFSNKAININDDEETTVSQKVEKLRTLLKTKGYKLIFKRRKNDISGCKEII